MAAPRKGPSRGGKVRKTAARRGGKTGSRRDKRGERGLPRNLREIYGVAIITLAVLLFLAFFASALGPVGRGLELFFAYLVGGVRYALPFILLVVGSALLLGRLGDMASREQGGWRLTWVEMAGTAVMLMAVSALLHLRSGDAEAMFSSNTLQDGGGLVGAVIAWPLVKMFSRTGAYVLIIAMFVVGFLLLSGLTFSKYLQERVERRKRKRSEKRVRRAAKTAEGEPGQQGLKAEGNARHVDRTAVARDENEGATHPGPEPRETAPSMPEMPAPPRLVVEDTGQIAIGMGEKEKGKAYRLPPVELLQRTGGRSSITHKSVNESISILERTLSDFGVDAAVMRVTRGPTVTRFEVELASGVKVNRVLNLSDDIAYALASPEIRIITPIPGKSAIGVEIPNRERDLVTLGDIIANPEAAKVASPLRVGLGMDVSGQPVMVDLRDMPHLLLAGATGTGKSCCINSMIASVLLSAPPHEVRMLMVDPKYVELSHFNGIPHLLSPVITDPKRASAALGWTVREMEQRYQVLSAAGMKNVLYYRAALKEGLEREESEEGGRRFPPMPYILVVIDELADLMMVAPAEVEDSIARIAQMARAVGIHLVVATQRPSVDVVTGLIKANMPSRIAFTVASQADSRVILDAGGAEKLSGHGDMLFLPAGSSKAMRVQGAYIAEREITAVTAFIKRQRQADYRDDILEEASGGKKEQTREDELIEEAIEVVVRMGAASASLLQRKLRVGYARAARLVDLLEEMGVVGGPEGSRPRAVLMSVEELEERKARKANGAQ